MKTLCSIAFLIVLCTRAVGATLVLYDTGFEPAPASPAWTYNPVAGQNSWFNSGGSSARIRVITNGFSGDNVVGGVTNLAQSGAQFVRFTASSSVTTNNSQFAWPDVTAGFEARPAGFNKLTASLDVRVPSTGSADTSTYGMLGYDNDAEATGNYLDFGYLIVPSTRAIRLVIDGAIVATATGAFDYNSWFNVAVEVDYESGDVRVLTNGVPVGGLSSNSPYIVGATLTDVDLYCVNSTTAGATRVVFADNYRLVVASPAGPPGNDMFNDAFAMAGLSGLTNGTTAFGTAEGGEYEHAGYSPVASVWYRWTAPMSGVFSFDTLNSAANTVIGIYTGTSVDGLLEESSNDDADGSVLQSRADLNAAAGQTYQIAVDTVGGTGPFVLRWRPTVRVASTVQPGNQLMLTVDSAKPGSLNIQSSTNLNDPANWSTIGTVQFPAPGGGASTNFNAGPLSGPRKFFRVAD